MLHFPPVGLALQAALADTLALVDTVARTAAPAVVAPAAPFSAAEFLARGGWALVPIALALLAALVALAGARRAIRDAGDDADGLLQTVGDYIRGGNLIGALDFCRSQDTAAARVVAEGLARLGRPLGDIQTAVASAARREGARVQDRFELVRAAALLMPVFGLLGTTSGLITVLRTAGAAAPAASALWPPLVPTAVGAIAAVLVVAVHLASTGRAADIAAGLDTLAGDFLQMLKSPAEKRAG